MTNTVHELSSYQGNMPPPPNIPAPRPERPPPEIPNPEPEPQPEEKTKVGGDVAEAFKCQKCGKTFNSKDELDLHIETDHKSRKLPEQQ